ncbi:zinc-binding dehydrogenase [Rhizobiales bacterium RZME27]|uniref:Zinc-binding dehydrogenase n=1 Tax=Endobacterium cereale TaxID=2663029 RepID=A0A6A8ACH4_9HYPH|nr:zinc-binding alcohol dehydrogenase family protein [Endobacterium cereale]MQY46906.1 zinc-binding dehydrogenase [Endobacterium cereale]
MHAAVYDHPGEPGVFRFIPVADPQPGRDDVLIAVEAISIEGGDLINRRLVAPPADNHIVGYAAAGTIIAVGADVTDRKVGDRVTSFDMSGSHATKRAVPASRTWHVPDKVDMTAAAALPISVGTAHHCLFARGGLVAGETVLIHAAAGGVGLAAVQLADRAGAKVIAVVSASERQERLRALGADHVIDRKQQDVAEEVMRITGGSGAELVVDPVGSTLNQSLSMLAPEGRLVFVGNAGGGDLAANLWPAMQANQSLLGVFMGPLLERPVVHATVDDMLADVANGDLQVVIERVFPLAQAADAHAFAETGKPLGRVIMTP